MSLTPRSLDTLIDLVEIKLSCLEIYDRDDAREFANLKQCLQELSSLAGRKNGAAEPEVALPKKSRRRVRAAAAV